MTRTLSLAAAWLAVLAVGRAESPPAPPPATPPAGNAPLLLTADVPWIVSAEEPEAVGRALADVQADWYKVLGRPPIVLRRPPEAWHGPVVYLGLKGDWRKEMVKDPFPGPESFLIRAGRDPAGRPALVATGADVRGTIYAAYALSEELLGVDPWYYWVDKPPVFRGQIAVPADYRMSFGPPTFRYRGWFINDEDLLSGYAPDPMRENVFALSTWDRIYETLLRLRGNMIVPGTFTFPDEKCQDLASRRGLVLNMHHILVVGLNTYRWPKGVPFSYSRHPEIMERYWQTCIDAFKDKEVVWTVGYRGKHNRPFWADEPEVATPEARGALITKAIARQVEMIRRVQPKAAIITNLWDEGADLYRAGRLKLPPGVTVVWPDDGTGVIRDQGMARPGQGIYYHTAMLSWQTNQLCEMVNPGRIAREVGRLTRAGATEFFLLNVSDIRPVPLSTDCAMKMVWNAQPFLGRSEAENRAAFLRDWCARQYGPKVADRAAALYDQFFDIPYMREPTRCGENSLHARIRRLDDKVVPLLEKRQQLGDVLLKEAGDNLEFTVGNTGYLDSLWRDASALTTAIPAGRRDFYQSHLCLQVEAHRAVAGHAGVVLRRCAGAGRRDDAGGNCIPQTGQGGLRRLGRRSPPGGIRQVGRLVPGRVFRRAALDPRPLPPPGGDPGGQARPAATA